MYTCMYMYVQYIHVVSLELGNSYTKPGSYQYLQYMYYTYNVIILYMYFSYCNYYFVSNVFVVFYFSYAVYESFNNYTSPETLDGDNKYLAGNHGMQVLQCIFANGTGTCRYQCFVRMTQHTCYMYIEILFIQ